MTKLTKINSTLFIKSDSIESIEVIRSEGYGEQLVKIQAKNCTYTAKIAWWRLKRITEDYEDSSPPQTELINDIVSLLTDEGYPTEYLQAFIRIINMSNWNRYTEWAVLQFAKHLQGYLTQDRLLGVDDG